MSINDDDITTTGTPGEGPADGGANPEGHDGGADGSADAGEGPADGGANPERSRRRSRRIRGRRRRTRGRRRQPGRTRRRSRRIRLSEPDLRGPSDRPALARLSGIPASDFSREYWGEQPLLTHREDGFADLFSASAVDELVAERGLRTPFARMASEGSVLSPSLFTAPGGFGAEVGDQLDSAKVLEQFAGGATLVLQGLHRTWQPIAAFTRQLVADLGHPAQVNAYITPASSRGFDPHYDTHDVFVIQIAGAKRWTIHEPVHRHPLADQPWTDHRDAVAARARTEPRIDAVFEPGDVLYLPRGWIHSAVAQGGTSIHLTIGVRAATRHDLLTRLLARGGDEPALRSPLPLGVDYADATSLDADLAATVAAARDLLQRCRGRS